MDTPFELKNDNNSHYGLGIFIGSIDGHKVMEHSGEVGGFVAENMVFPDDHAAITVLTNQEASGAASEIAHALEPLVLHTAASASPADATADAFTPQLRTVMTGLLQGQIDRTLFTPDCNAYFDRDALSDFQSSLSPLGTVAGVTRERASLRGGMTFGSYRVAFSGGSAIRVTVYLQPDGKIEQLLVEGKA